MISDEYLLFHQKLKNVLMKTNTSLKKDIVNLMKSKPIDYDFGVSAISFLDDPTLINFDEKMIYRFFFLWGNKIPHKIKTLDVLIEYGFNPLQDYFFMNEVMWVDAAFHKGFLKACKEHQFRTQDGQDVYGAVLSSQGVPVYSIFKSWSKICPPQPSLQDSNGDTVLHHLFAIGESFDSEYGGHEYMDTLELFMEHGADPSIQNNDLKTAIDLLEERQEDVEPDLYQQMKVRMTSFVEHKLLSKEINPAYAKSAQRKKI